MAGSSFGSSTSVCSSVGPMAGHDGLHGAEFHWMYECVFLIFQLRQFFVQNFSHFSLLGYLRKKNFYPKF